MLIKVYYTDPKNNRAYSWDCISLTDGLTITERFRREGMTFVTMVCQDPNSIGQPGVDSVEQGVLPNGDTYTWKKRRP